MAEYIKFPNRKVEPGPMPPSASKPKPTSRRKPLKRETSDRAAKNRIKDKVKAAYFADNPECDGDCGEDSYEFHHICRGANRARSLMNPNTALGGCPDCHKVWDGMSIAEQVAIKWLAIVRAVNRYLAPKGHPNPPHAVSVADVVECLRKRGKYV